MEQEQKTTVRQALKQATKMLLDITEAVEQMEEVMKSQASKLKELLPEEVKPEEKGE